MRGSYRLPRSGMTLFPSSMLRLLCLRQPGWTDITGHTHPHRLPLTPVSRYIVQSSRHHNIPICLTYRLLYVFVLPPTHADPGTQPVDNNPFPRPPSVPPLDLPWLPISPNSLLHPAPGDPDSSSDDSPLDWWTWGTNDGLGDWANPPGPSTEVDGDILAPPLTLVTSNPGRRISVHPPKALRIEDVLPWSTLMKILQSYRAHL